MLIDAWLWLTLKSYGPATPDWPHTHLMALPHLTDPIHILWPLSHMTDPIHILWTCHTWLTPYTSYGPATPYWPHTHLMALPQLTDPIYILWPCHTSLTPYTSYGPVTPDWPHTCLMTLSHLTDPTHRHHHYLLPIKAIEWCSNLSIWNLGGGEGGDWYPALSVLRWTSSTPSACVG